MAAEVEEVVVDADRIAQAEQILPDPGDHLLDGIAGRRPRRGVRLAAIASGAGSARRSTLPLALSGSSARGTKRDGTMCSGRLSRRWARSSAGAGRVRAFRHVVGDQTVAAGRSSAAVTTASRTPGWREERALHLPELDAEAAHLDLEVAPAEEVERPVRPPAREIARAVEPASPGPAGPPRTDPARSARRSAPGGRGSRAPRRRRPRRAPRRTRPAAA